MSPSLGSPDSSRNGKICLCAHDTPCPVNFQQFLGTIFDKFISGGAVKFWAQMEQTVLGDNKIPYEISKNCMVEWYFAELYSMYQLEMFRFQPYGLSLRGKITVLPLAFGRPSARADGRVSQ